MRLRHLKHLNANEQVAVIHSYLKGKRTMRDIADEHSITRGLVSRLVKKYKADPGMIAKTRSKEESQ